MTLRELVERNRSYRRFHEDEPLSREFLTYLVGLARLGASSANLQPLKYILSWTPEKNARIFDCLGWAGYLTDWPGPAQGERPPAYIIVLGDREISDTIVCDHGIAAENILLGAVEKGFGGCIISNIDRERLRSALSIPERYRILITIALGRPAERVVIEEARGDIRYWRNRGGVHHVPKRPLEEIILDL